MKSSLSFPGLSNQEIRKDGVRSDKMIGRQVHHQNHTKLPDGRSRALSAEIVNHEVEHARTDDFSKEQSHTRVQDNLRGGHSKYDCISMYPAPGAGYSFLHRILL